VKVNGAREGQNHAFPGFFRFDKDLDNPGLMDVFRTILKTS